MKAIRNINNNIALCIDDNQNELIAFGKGIGVKKCPKDLELSEIERTFYSVDEKYHSLIASVPQELIFVCEKIVTHAEIELDCTFSPNVVFTLADHVNYAIIRTKKNIPIIFPAMYDVKYLYPEEYAIGKYAVKCIKDTLQIELNKIEEEFIALHFIDADSHSTNKIPSNKIDQLETIDKITEIIEARTGKKIDREGFNYSRFQTHIQYLISRLEENSAINTENIQLIKDVKNRFPEMYECAEEISNYTFKKYGIPLNSEEKLYLAIHINRLCSREDDQVISK